jgi:hypothetical protein
MSWMLSSPSLFEMGTTFAEFTRLR